MLTLSFCCSLAGARSGRPAQFSQLLELAGVYKEGDRPPPATSKTSAAKDKTMEAVFPQQAEDAAEVTSEGSSERLSQYSKKANKTSTRTAIEKQEREEDLQGSGYMPRSNLPFSPGFPRIPLPTPQALGFPGVESFLDNFEKSVLWKEGEREKLRRGRRAAGASLLGGGGHHHRHGVGPNDLLPLGPPLHIDHQVRLRRYVQIYSKHQLLAKGLINVNQQREQRIRYITSCC